MAQGVTEKFLTVSEVADLLNCSKSTIWRRSADQTLPQPVKFGHTTRWPLSEIESYIELAKSSRAAEAQR